MHWGQDHGWRNGRTLVAPEAGVLVSFTYNIAAGHRVIIRGDSGTLHSLAHCAPRLADGVNVGDRLDEGQPVATMSDSGGAVGVNVHWEVTQGGRLIDPQQWLYQFAGDAGTPIPPEKEEDDMYDDAAEARLRQQLELGRPLKLIALVDDKGAGGWLWVDREGQWVICPTPAYALLVAAWGLSQPTPIRAVQQAEFDYMTRQLLGPLGPSTPLGRVAELTALDEATVDRIVAGISAPPVVLTEAQLEQVTQAAREGSIEGVRALQFVTVAS